MAYFSDEDFPAADGDGEATAPDASSVGDGPSAASAPVQAPAPWPAGSIGPSAATPLSFVRALNQVAANDAASADFAQMLALQNPVQPEWPGQLAGTNAQGSNSHPLFASADLNPMAISTDTQDCKFIGSSPGTEGLNYGGYDAAPMADGSGWKSAQQSDDVSDTPGELIRPNGENWGISTSDPAQSNAAQAQTESREFIDPSGNNWRLEDAAAGPLLASTMRPIDYLSTVMNGDVPTMSTDLPYGGLTAPRTANDYAASSAPNKYPDYDLGTQDGMRQYIDDILWRKNTGDSISPDEMNTARTILSSYYGLGGTLENALGKWNTSSPEQLDARFARISNQYASYNQISDEDYAAAAKRLGVDEAAIRAVADVETKGLGFISEGNPTILFERDKFGDSTGHQYDDDYPDISNTTAGGYGSGGAHQYDRLNQAMDLDSDAALKSASWGKFQMMGANYQQAGYSSVTDFVDAMKTDATTQLDAFSNFIENTPHLLDALKNHDWATFARYYNGSGYSKNNYDEKLQSSYEKFSH